MRRSAIVLLAGTLALTPRALAQSSEPESVPSEGPGERETDEDELDLADLRGDDVMVYGARIPDPDSTPHATTTFTETDLRRQQPLSVVDVVRRAPGITVRDEDGVGLRPSIGYRGLLADRSRNVLLLEDGVPISVMPYDYAEHYVAPAVERYRSIELVHGAAMLLYGPRTIGAVINFVTLEPPAELTVVGDARIGTDGYGYGFASAGDTIGDLGVLITAMYQHFDGPRHLDLNRLDTMARFTLDLHDAGELRFKLQWYDEGSTATNVGLTQVQFDHGILDNFAQQDRSPVQRGATQLTHQIEISPDVSLATTAYFSLTTRNWWRQDFYRAALPGAPIDRIVNGLGQTLAPDAMGANDGSAIYFSSTTTGRLREYMVTGIEPRLTGRYDVGWMRGEVIAGLRLHYERSRDADMLGATPRASYGSTVNAQVRDVVALAAFIRPTFEFFDRHLEIAPGLRVETMVSTVNQTVMQDVVPSDGTYHPQTGTALATPAFSSNSLAAPLPGVSGVVRLTDGDELSLFGGVHRGFVPPGVRDSILGTGRDTQLLPEYSWNYELGMRGTPAAWADFELTMFSIDYLTADLMATEASMGMAGGLAASGPERMWGGEGRVRFDPIRAAGLDFELPLSVSYTHVDARFGYRTVDGAGVDVTHNFVPYVPEHTLSARVDFAHPFGVEAQLSVDYTSSQFADPENRREATLDGVSGPIPARAVMNARLAYTYAPWGITFYVDARNLLDAHYVASRAPAGINPGMTRQIFGGIRIAY